MTTPAFEWVPKMANAASASGALTQSARRARMIWVNRFTAQPPSKYGCAALPQNYLASPIQT